MLNIQHSKCIDTFAPSLNSILTSYLYIIMIKKISLLVILFAALMTSCQLGTNSGDTGSDQQKATVKEVIQTSAYTYLRVKKGRQEQWIAVNKANIAEGDVVYYEEGMEMKNFKSPELGRTFESVYFVQEISDQPIKKGMPGGMQGNPHGGNMGDGMMGDQPEKPVIEKIDIKIEHSEGVITIGNLYEKKDDYAGKLVTVTGKVTKVNIGIMGRNWVHIQDGTSDGENFDLTITTDDEPVMGTIVTYSGTLGIDKDFGYGYYYPILVENAQPIKEI